MRSSTYLADQENQNMGAFFQYSVRGTEIIALFLSFFSLFPLRCCQKTRILMVPTKRKIHIIPVSRGASTTITDTPLSIPPSCIYQIDIPTPYPFDIE